MAVASSSLLLGALSSSSQAQSASPAKPTGPQPNCLQDIDLSSVYSSGNFHLNDKGDIFGYFFGAEGNVHSFFFSGGDLVQVDAPGWLNTGVTGMNNSGIMAGSYDDTMIQYGFLYDTKTGEWTQLPDPPNSWYAAVTDINDKGEVLGFTGGGAFGKDAAFIYDGKHWEFFTVKDQNGVEYDTYPHGISNRDMVTGWCVDPNHKVHGFLQMARPPSCLMFRAPLKLLRSRSMTRGMSPGPIPNSIPSGAIMIFTGSSAETASP